jgi:16S rRNA (uracil1498-N3)-methyltransferase
MLSFRKQGSDTLKRAFCDDLGEAGGLVELSREETRHVVRVRRGRTGDEIVLFDGRGRQAFGRLESVDSGPATVSIERVEAAPPDTACRLTLVTAIPKGPRMADLVRACTEVGVAEIRPVVAERSSVRPDIGSTNDRWQRVAREAAKQSRRSYLPEISPVATLATALTGAFSLILVADAGDDAAPLRSCLGERGEGATALLMVGPEGGFSPDELRMAVEAGARRFRLDVPVMRVETAAPVLAGLVLYELS